jgi:hypothetical protein
MKYLINKLILISLTFIIITGVVACQPTPEKKAVVENSGQIEEAMNASAAPTKGYNYPSSYKTSFNNYNGSLNVSVNANIDFPATKKFPIYEITTAFFSQELTSNLVQVLMGNQKIYVNSRTRPDIENDLIQAKELYADVKSGKYGHITDFSFYTDQINQLEKELAEAPQNSTNVESDGKLVTNETGNELDIKADLGKNRFATLKIQNNMQGNLSNCFFCNGNQYSEDSGTEQAKGIKMTPDDAIKAAKDFLQKTGLNYFQPVYAKKGSVYLQGDQKTDQEGYVITCTRMVDNIPITYNTAAGSDELKARFGNNQRQQSAVYFPFMLKEKFTMTFDDSGLTTLNWDAPINTKMLNQNVELMDFEKMMPLFKQAMINKYSWLKEPEKAEGNITGLTVNINRITLGFAKTPIKDKSGEYMLVPAWDFFGSYTEKYQAQADSTTDCSYASFATISAIDGSIINLGS